MKLRSSKTKLFYETSFKTEASKLKNQAFLRNVLQKWSFEALKRSFSARLPSKMKLRNSKTKLFWATSFKNDTSGTNRVTGDHKGDTPFLCDRCGTPSTLGHLWPYLFYFKSQATNAPRDRRRQKTLPRNSDSVGQVGAPSEDFCGHHRHKVHDAPVKGSSCRLPV